MILKQLREYAAGEIVKHPAYETQIIDLVSLAESEIEEGGSEHHECELAVDSIDQLTEGKP